MDIPFVDLETQYNRLRPEIDDAIQSVIDDTAFVRGPYVSEFEEAYAEAYGVDHCISVSNGTDAIYVVLRMLGIGPGDEVITVANSWISTSETIGQTGAKPVFVDIEPEYFNIDADQIEEKISENTKAIIPVHLYGQPAKIDTVTEIARAHDLYVIEDTAQAHFAEYDGQRVGTFGIAGTFSFYPGKNLGAYGDAGAIVTNDDELARRCRMFSDHGASEKHDHEIEGINSRLDGIQAAVLSVKLPYILDWNQDRYEHAQKYTRRLKDIPGITPPAVRSDASHVFHLYVIRVDEGRDELQSFLESQGISTSIHYPTALPFLKAYEHRGFQPSDFPVAHDYQEQILSLPMYPEMTEEMIDCVTSLIGDWAKERS
ncbi:DegT/DnrJ/EryC1/StrS family aminotransferase [Salinibacter sp.]|uniref:DegT/DnrJ/EryC1/StrS family aminotransferase n=1 Tax=Salinibacter sp. TaxID=2065818 RepID=UPI0021E973B0|nr:DegT/DnrJ/EryC1/StrS family aminotransferase [Salinibacter sp.]